jgi:hypothetical protein
VEAEHERALGQLRVRHGRRAALLCAQLPGCSSCRNEVADLPPKNPPAQQNWALVY